MKYNKALDYTVLALNEMASGKHVLAARLFAKAAEQPDLTAAIRILEASNAAAFSELQASKVEAKTAPKARLKAEAEDEIDAPVEPEIEEEDLEGDPLEQVADFEEEGAEEEEEEPVEESPAMAVAKVLASMQRRAK